MIFVWRDTIQALERTTDMNPTKCRHFNGIQHKECKAGICYLDVRKTPTYPNTGASFPCLPDSNKESATCSKFDPFTQEEIAKMDAESARVTSLILRDLSPCCEAAIDKSRVIPSGQHKGHGPRFCSACKKLVYMV
jgi:hypothetical protein